MLRRAKGFGNTPVVRNETGSTILRVGSKFEVEKQNCSNHFSDSTLTLEHLWVKMMTENLKRYHIFEVVFLGTLLYNS
jgi:hypothetical protein